MLAFHLPAVEDSTQRFVLLPSGMLGDDSSTNGEYRATLVLVGA